MPILSTYSSLPSPVRYTVYYTNSSLSRCCSGYGGEPSSCQGTEAVLNNIVIVCMYSVYVTESAWAHIKFWLNFYDS